MANIKLDEVIKEFLVEIGEESMGKYARYLSIALSGLRELNADSTGEPKLVNLDISPVNTADLPSDYVDYIAIYICDDNGTLQPLGRNDSICPPAKDDCGNDVDPSIVTNDTTDISAGFFYYNQEGGYVRNGELVGRRFGMGGGNNRYGKYKLDESNGRILFQDLEISTSRIYLEYIATARVDESGNHYIPEFAIEAIKSWMWWKYVQRSRTQHLAEKDMARREYYNQKRVARLRSRTFNMDELLAAYRTGFKQSPKL